jgi:hypothetical protein
LLGQQQDRLRQQQRLADAMGLSGHEPSVASVALYGWLAFGPEVDLLTPTKD